MIYNQHLYGKQCMLTVQVVHLEEKPQLVSG